MDTTAFTEEQKQYLDGFAAGAGLRYEAGRLALRQFGPGFPWGTLAVNLIGGLAMGLLAGWIGGSATRPAWFLLGVGLLGGFTTFSAYSLDLFQMLERGRPARRGTDQH